MAFKEFYDYRRPSGVTISDFFVKFEYLYHKIGQLEVKLPEGVRAFFLVTAANVSEENEKLACATCGEMTYDNMKTAIKKIFGDPAASNGGGAPAVKSEPVLMAEHESALYTRGWRGWRPRGRGRGQRGYRQYSSGRETDGGARGFRQQNSGRESEDGVNNYRKNNPTGKDGKIMRCFNCDSTEHFSRYCNKRKENNEKLQEIHITLLNSDNKMFMLVKESLGM